MSSRYKDYCFDVELEVAADEDAFDALLLQIVDEEAAVSGWECYAVGKPPKLHLTLVGDTQEVTPRGCDSFCHWLSRQDAVVKCRSTGIRSSHAELIQFVHVYEC